MWLLVAVNVMWKLWRCPHHAHFPKVCVCIGIPVWKVVWSYRPPASRCTHYPGSEGPSHSGSLSKHPSLGSSSFMLPLPLFFYRVFLLSSLLSVLHTGDLSHLLLSAPYNYTMWPPPFPPWLHSSCTHSHTWVAFGTDRDCFVNTQTLQKNFVQRGKYRFFWRMVAGNGCLRASDKNRGGRRWLK